ncbi:MULTISPECIES: ROK family glucokinase [unclassified Knoellia]|uniref:ROK family glucokinase n=1 Tax=unclassified Knoellia TaxID=2618719 RepID=UPI0023DB4163|nr:MULTISPECIES: ROK family glucokinase [unclassified Knoellia]MDF2092372.1 ROK family glucokinase [Knoellia sp. 3-2P3]MDF2143641.1 ROK family glucokinase [Knoellia sp. p5-6-4]
MTATIGLDIGGTKIAAGLVSLEGRILAEARCDTPAHDPDRIAHDAAALVAALSADTDQEVVGVGVACAGFVNRTGSHVLFAPNLAWRDEPLKQRLEALVRYPVTIENDANAAAWGEFRFGAAREADDMVLITIGTGVGGGIVSDSKLLRGAYGIGGELGHMRVVPGGIRCGCGNRGCWEQYGSGNALLREARELVASGTPHGAALADACGGDPAALRGRDVTEVAQGGDPAAVELLADLGTWIGEGAASVAAILDPELIVIGGGVAEAGDLLLDPVRAAYGRQLTGRGHRPVAGIVPASLGNDAGLIGAAAIAAEGVLE